MKKYYSKRVSFLLAALFILGAQPIFSQCLLKSGSVCSQLNDNGTEVGLATTTTTYNLVSGSPRNDSKLFIDMSSQGSYAGLMLKGNGVGSNWPTFGFSLINNHSPVETILGASITGQITSVTAGAETMDMVFQTKPSGGQEAENMRITSTGYVGIGTASPANKVDILVPSTVSVIGLNAHNTGSSANNGGTAILGTADYAGLGNVGVAGTSLNAALNAGVYGYSTASSGFVSDNIGVWGYATSGPTNYGVYGSIGTDTTHPANCAGFFNGDVVSTRFFFSGSDEKLKTNVHDFKNSLEMLKKLQPKTYDFKINEYGKTMNLPTGNQIGIMAQDLQTVFPNLVREKETPAQFDPVTHQKTGEATKFLAVSYVGLVPVLVEAVNELNGQLQSQVATLQAQNAALQNQINDLCNGGCAALKGAVDQQGNMLLQNVPNPFSQQTSIGYVINAGTTAYMNINALDGKVIKHLPLTVGGAGAVTINANELTPGTYTYTLIVDTKVVDTKIMVITAQD